MKQFLTYVFLLLSLSQCKKKEVDPEPLAAFSVQNNNCTAPCEVAFTNASKDATSYRWDFADGQSSSEQSPKHTYTVAGTYIVKLTTKGPGGSHDVTQTITIQAQPAPPVADFSFTGGNCSAPCEVVFTNKSIKADSFQWDFGDGSNSTEVNPRHQYTKGGTFQVALTAKGSGQTATKTQSVTINSAIASKIWDKTFGGTGSDDLFSVVATPDGGFLLAGSSSSSASGDKSEASKGGSDYWIVKINDSGVKQWDRTFGGTNSETLLSAIATPDGGFLLGGYSSSQASGDKSEASKGGDDYWVVKVSANGTKQWDKTFGTPDRDNLRSVVATPDGGFLLAGSIILDGLFTNADYWLVKITSNGTKQWDKILGGTGFDFLSAAVVTSDGGFLLGGYSNSSVSGDKSENAKGDRDYWIVKINDSGVKQWDKTFGGTGNEILNSVVATPDGGFLLAGSSSSSASGDKSEASQGGADYWIVKINNSGIKQWDKTFGGNLFENFASVIATPDGSFLLGGYSNSPVSGDKSEDIRGREDYWVVKVSANGTKQGDKTFGGADSDYLKAAVTTADGGFLLVGSSTSSTSGDKSENSKGSFDFWVIKIK